MRESKLRRGANSAPTELTHKLKEVREVFPVGALEREVAPSSPMELQDKSIVVMEVFTVRAWEMAVAPSSRIKLKTNPKWSGRCLL